MGGVVGGVVAHVILVSAQGPNPFFFFFWGTFIQIGVLLGQGLGLGLGPGLDNYLDQSLNIITCGDGTKQICRYKSRPLQGIHTRRNLDIQRWLRNMVWVIT